MLSCFGFPDGLGCEGHGGDTMKRKQYSFKLTIKEGNDGFWERLAKLGRQETVSELREVITDSLLEFGFDEDYDFNIEFLGEGYDA